MPERTTPIEALEKRLRVLGRKLERSEWHRVDLENQHDRDQHLYRRLHAELDAARREAEIEAALERVRARAMAMHTSEELLDVVFEIHRQYSGLGLPCDAFWHTRYTPESYHKALTGFGGQKLAALMELPRDFSKVPALAAWERGDDPVGVFPFGAEAACAYLHHMVERGRFDELDPDAITEEMVREHGGWTFVQARTSHGEIGYSLWGETEPSEEAKGVLVRFARTFDLAYRRFEDLRQAEERARESEIELALERVRARTMAMQRSAELSDVASVLFEQLQHLGGQLWGTGFAFCSEDSDADVFWFANQGGILPPVSIPNTEDPVHAAMYAGWKAGQELYTDEMGGERLAAHYRYMLGVPDVRPFFQEILDSGMSFPTWQKWHAAYFSHGYLLAITVEPYADEAIFVRFAKVFEQAYIRFRDLQRAEAQAREAQVEAALERVRGRAMAMRASTELAALSFELVKEVRDLGVATWHCAFNIYDEGGESSTEWGSNGEVIYPRYETPREGIFLEYYRIGQTGASMHIEEIGEDRSAAHYEWLCSLPGVGEQLCALRDSGVAFPTYQIDHVAYFEYGYLIFITYEPVPQAHDIFLRFAKVFEQAYTRFLDLKRAEEQAREAVQQAALDRVRAEIASMRTAADLEHITPLVWRELTALGVPFFRCGVFIVDEESESAHTYLTTPEGRALAVLPLGFDDAPVIASIVAHWRRGAVYREEWDADDMRAWTAMLQARGLIPAPAGYLDAGEPPEHLALHFVPFEQGMLYVGSRAPLDADALDAVQALAEAFAVAYARYEDFQRLEAKNREVEAALGRLQTTQQQLIHAEKMASLGQLTAGIAHEIKNPLNFINNFAEVSSEIADELLEALRDGGDGEDVEAIIADLKRNAAVIAQHGRRADGIVRSMMQHASGGTGQREATDVNPLVAEHVELAYHGKLAQVPGLAVEVEQELSDDAGAVVMVPREIGRVLLNLLGNAFDAVHEHAATAGDGYAPRVVVSTRRAGGHVEIRVSDNGPGIPEGVRERIFQPFFTTKPAGSGTGLGLSLSYDIVAQGHGGSLRVESQPGEGATFVVMLPGEGG